MLLAPDDMTLSQYNDWLVRPQAEWDNMFFGVKIKTVAEYQAPSGRTYKGVNSEVDPALLPDDLKAALASVENPHEYFHGWCAEIAAVSKAMQAGERVDGGVVRIMKHRVEGGVVQPEHGDFYVPCRSCRPSLRTLNIKWKGPE